MSLSLIDQGYGVTTIDTGFKRPGMVASHLLVEDGRAAFVDVGATPNVGILLSALQQLRLEPQQVDYVIVTHVHLDHAGGAGALLRELPGAKLVVHPRGARHMVDPSRLVAGATAVYGQEGMRASFGEIVPVPQERVIEAPDESSIELNGRTLLCLDTPGHARHHLCLVDNASRGIFTGDTFGVSYRELDSGSGAFIFPTTTPVQFDPEALHASIDRLMQYRPERMFLTHFGCVGQPQALADALHMHIDRFVEIARAAADSGAQRGQRLVEMLAAWLCESAQAHGCILTQEQIHALLHMDIELNAQGLECWLQQGEQAAS